MAELRLDLTLDEWVVVAPERGKRPQDGPSPCEPERSEDSRADCPFCPGCESLTPPEIERLSLPDSKSAWDLRVVPNQYPAFGADPSAPAKAADGLSRPARGAHEVIVESPVHVRALADFSDDEIALVFTAYQRRWRALRELADVGAITVFRNSGEQGGASKQHPHAQVIATTVEPPTVEKRWRTARTLYREHGACLYCRMCERERQGGARLVFESRHWAAVCPFAARGPYETWILPRAHQGDFGGAAPEVLRDAALCTRRVLRALREAAGDCPYNYVLHSGPPGERDPQWFCWSIQILPRLSTPAGFELATGMAINPSSPEQCAQELRKSAPDS